jgi:hypothetical protein
MRALLDLMGFDSPSRFWAVVSLVGALSGVAVTPATADPLATPTNAPVAQPVGPPLSVVPIQTPRPCTCRAQGADFTVGTMVCLATPSGARMARCEMVLNNTSWTFLPTPCPQS